MPNFTANSSCDSPDGTLKECIKHYRSNNYFLCLLVYTSYFNTFLLYPTTQKQRAQHQLRPSLILILFSQFQKYLLTTASFYSNPLWLSDTKVYLKANSLIKTLVESINILAQVLNIVLLTAIEFHVVS